MNGNLDSFLAGKSVVCLDTCTLIYFFEENPIFLPVVEKIFGKVDSGELRGISSFLTLIEVLIKPLKEGAHGIADHYRDALLDGQIKLYPVGEEISEEAAKIRAKYGIRVPDAIQVATAIHGGADVFITNDSRFKRVTEIPILCLNDYVILPVSGQKQPASIISWFKKLFN